MSLHLLTFAANKIALSLSRFPSLSHGMRLFVFFFVLDNGTKYVSDRTPDDLGLKDESLNHRVAKHNNETIITSIILHALAT